MFFIAVAMLTFIFPNMYADQNLAEEIPYTIIEDTSNLPLLNPDLQERKTLKLRLKNGMGVLLISDPKADQSAAALRVDVGSWSDPEKFPGMAHFCEHMLFLGTKTYPSEKEFHSLCSDYAGRTNAFTGPERTVYMFAAEPKGFFPILERFAHFFIDPLFNPEFIEKELHAVDQEYSKNLENDGWRNLMVFKETANPEHPVSKFSIGNSSTLKSIPHEMLKTWHREHYGAEKMHLVLYSSKSLEELKKKSLELFSQVEKSERERLPSQHPITSPMQIGNILYVTPIKKKQSLTLSWELPLTLCEDDSKSIDILAFALSQGHENSLSQELKNQHLIDNMSVYVDTLGGKKHRFFEVDFDLTDRGVKRIEEIGLLFFETIAKIKENGVPEYLFDESNALKKLRYQYQQRQNPFEFITELADSLAEEDLSTYPRNTLLAKEYNPVKIQFAAHFLSPKNCFVNVIASPEITKVQTEKTEKWLHAEYAIRKIPDAWMKKWEMASPSKMVSTPPPNPYIPKELSLKEGEEKDPELVYDGPLGKAYYVREPNFGSLQVQYTLHIFSEAIVKGPKGSVLASLYIDHITDLLQPTLMAAHSAGIDVTFDFRKSALYINLCGFSEKAPLLLAEILKNLSLSPPTKERFALYIERHEKAYFNGQKELAAYQAKELFYSLVSPENFTKKAKLSALQEISFEDFLKFHSDFLKKTYTKVLFSGNLTKKEAESLWLDLTHVLGESPLEKLPDTYPPHLEGEGPYKLVEKTDLKGGATLLVIDEGSFSHEQKALQSILASAIEEPFFSELRTKQKTGYIVHSSNIEVENELFQYFLVQSSSHSPEELLFRFEQFLELFRENSIEKNRFETIRNSIISSLKTQFRNLKIKSALWDFLCFEKDADFTYIDQRIEALKALNFEDFQAYVKKILGRENKKRLAILIKGNLSKPFSYKEITLQETLKKVLPLAVKSTLSND